MSRLAWGELDISVPDTDRKDEIGKLTKALQAFHEAAVEREAARKAEAERNEAEKKRAHAIQTTTGQFEDKVAIVVNTVASAATELAQTSQSLVEMMSKTGKTLESAASGASETTANVHSVASAAEEMTASIREISSQLQHSNSTVQASVRKAEQIDEQAALLNAATTKVKEVIGLISDIAAQINLLALNATIESARAGEAGRGFAVVASEVKNLAGQTDKSIQEIEKVIQEMDSASVGIIQSLKEIKESIQDISGASGTIAAAVEEQSATTGEIARNMQSAAHGTELISSNLGDVAHSTRDAEASSDEVLSASQELSRQAEGLRRDVEEFLATMRAV
jgi:methyl-accepting chemotaxis protein